MVVLVLVVFTIRGGLSSPGLAGVCLQETARVVWPDGVSAGAKRLGEGGYKLSMGPNRVTRGVK